MKTFVVNDGPRIIPLSPNGMVGVPDLESIAAKRTHEDPRRQDWAQNHPVEPQRDVWSARSGINCRKTEPIKTHVADIGPPEQALTLRAMISCADDNAHVRVAGDEMMAFHPPCAATSNEGKDHLRRWKHCWMPQQQEKWEIGPPEQAVTHRAMISCADENAHVSVAGA